MLFWRYLLAPFSLFISVVHISIPVTLTSQFIIEGVSTVWPRMDLVQYNNNTGNPSDVLRATMNVGKQWVTDGNHLYRSVARIMCRSHIRIAEKLRSYVKS